jgi:hypothetical protein
MRQKDSTTGLRFASAAWPRRVVVGLWVVAFVLGAGALFARWDGLMTRLARPPVGEVATGGAPR